MAVKRQRGEKPKGHKGETVITWTKASKEGSEG